ncbi:MAG: CHAD domain-containing protein [Methylovirgula sp.]
MRRTRDISCRFDLDPRDCAWLQETFTRFGAKPAEETRDFALYIDTQRAEIGNRGLAFSIRRGGEITSEDVKSAVGSTAAGLPAPQGWEYCVEPLSAATPAAACHWFAALLRDRDALQSLRILFQIETQATPWDARIGRTTVAIRLECARITASRSQASYATAAFRCKGEPTEFFQLLTEISAKLRMSAEEIALRGYRFCAVLRESHITAVAPKLSASTDAATAFRTIARACVDHFLANEAAVRGKRDREAVHQCRVALRRLSTSLRLFSSLVSGSGREELRPALKLLTACLQKARDLDVLIADVIVPTIGRDPPAATGRLLRSIEARRDSAYDELVAALSAASTAALFLRIVGWIEAGDWSLDPKRKIRRREKIVRFAKRKLAKAAHKFKERCTQLEEANQEQRHHIRIRAKNLRYSSEFFEALVKAPGGKRAHRKTAQKRFRVFIAALKDLQTVLGKQNDVRTAQRFLACLRQEVGTDRAAELAAIETLAASVDASETEFLRKAGKARRALAKVKPFWSKL